MEAQRRRPSSRARIEHALGELSVPYAVALWLRAGGETDETIAEAIGVPVESVPMVIEIAEAKLDRLGDAEEDERA